MAASKQKTRNRVLLTAVILVLGSCGFLGGAAFWAGNTLESKAKSLPYHLAASRSLGMPTQLDDLLVHVKDPAEDALPDLEAAYALWKKVPEADQDSLISLAHRCLRATADPSEKHEFRERLATSASMMGLLRAAASKPLCSVNQVETWKNKERLEFWRFVRDGIRIYAAQGVMIGQEGNLVGAEAAETTALGITKHLISQPTYGAMIRLCIAEIEVQRAIERIIFANPGKDKEESEIIARIQERLVPMPSAATIMKSEIPLILDSLSDPKATGLDGVPAGEFFAEVGKSGAVELWNKYYKRLPEDPENQNEAEKVLLAMDKEADDTPFYGSYVNDYRWMMPLLRDMLARRRLAVEAQEVLARGSIDKLPEDPHSGKPLLTKKTDKGSVIYSVGRDATDDGGQDRRFGKGAPTNFDLIFRLPKT